MAPDQETEAQVMHKHDYTAHPHPVYWGCLVYPMATLPEIREGGQGALIGDEVAAAGTGGDPLGTVTAIYLDGMVELSTGDQVAAADLVLLRRAQ